MALEVAVDAGTGLKSANLELPPRRPGGWKWETGDGEQTRETAGNPNTGYVLIESTSISTGNAELVQVGDDEQNSSAVS